MVMNHNHSMNHRTSLTSSDYYYGSSICR